MAVTLEPLTTPDIPSAMDVHASSLAKNLSQEQKDLRSQEWTLVLDNPSAKTIKAMESGNLAGAAGFLIHDIMGSITSQQSR